MLRGSARRAVVAVRGVATRVDPAGAAVRRAAFVARIRAAAAWNNASVDLDIADDVVLGHGIRVSFQPWSENRLRIGSACRIEDDVLIQLKGGTIVLGERVELRRGVVLNVAGRLEMQGDNPVSWNSVIHCRSCRTRGQRLPSRCGRTKC